MLFYVKARSPRHFFFGFFRPNKLLNVVFIYSQTWQIWCKASTEQYAGSILMACIFLCILISNQNTKVSIYVVTNTSQWQKHPWDLWYQYCMCGLAGSMLVAGIHFYTNFKWVTICIVANTWEQHEASMTSGAPVLQVWSCWFDASARIHFVSYFQVKIQKCPYI